MSESAEFGVWMIAAMLAGGLFGVWIAQLLLLLWQDQIFAVLDRIASIFRR